jgi:hypothetical protein
VLDDVRMMRKRIHSRLHHPRPPADLPVGDQGVLAVLELQGHRLQKAWSESVKGEVALAHDH